MPELLIMNPGGKGRKRRTHHKRARARRNPSRRHHRRHRHNPAMFGGRVGVGVDFMQVGVGILGAVGADVGGNALLKFVPANFRTGWGKYAVKGGIVLLGSILISKVAGRTAAKTLAVGGYTLLGVDALREFVLPHVPGLSDLSPLYQESLGMYTAPAALSGYTGGTFTHTLSGLSGTAGPSTGRQGHRLVMDPGSDVEGWRGPWQ